MRSALIAVASGAGVSLGGSMVKQFVPGLRLALAAPGDQVGFGIGVHRVISVTEQGSLGEHLLELAFRHEGGARLRPARISNGSKSGLDGVSPHRNSWVGKRFRQIMRLQPFVAYATKGCKPNPAG